ncbi:hypothetical protein HMPREF0281_02533 [Corynebacterium ammoniagenes DSM 20306]|uniref:Uncharacterized protein n=1 Tax=Corynebacterium ammoniagenes DSM 20306 TaxID=649754 RepID=A0ABP2IGK2_CORAM|nr:hypothetical protein HMPREF0281_02533 [Corynebacterium ammoniagenes DSM 20306]
MGKCALNSSAQITKVRKSALNWLFIAKCVNLPRIFKNLLP